MTASQKIFLREDLPIEILASGEKNPERAPGLHFSEINNDLARKMIYIENTEVEVKTEKKLTQALKKFHYTDEEIQLLYQYYSQNPRTFAADIMSRMTFEMMPGMLFSCDAATYFRKEDGDIYYETIMDKNIKITDTNSGEILSEKYKDLSIITRFKLTPIGFEFVDLYIEGNDEIIESTNQFFINLKYQEQQIRNLWVACSDYQKHLETCIQTTEEKDANLYVNKLRVLQGLRETLTLNKPVDVILLSFKKELAKSRPLIEKNQDAKTIIFLKVIATILTLGLVVKLGLWKSTDQKATSKMEKIITKPSKNKNK